MPNGILSSSDAVGVAAHDRLANSLYLLSRGEQDARRSWRASRRFTKRPHIRMVITSSPLAFRAEEMIGALQENGFDCSVVCSPIAHRWLKWNVEGVDRERMATYMDTHFPGLWKDRENLDGVEQLEKLTGHPVAVLEYGSASNMSAMQERNELEALEELTGHKVLTQPRLYPWDVVDKPVADAILVFPASVEFIARVSNMHGENLNEMTVTDTHGKPVVMVPYSNDSHINHRANLENIERLRTWGNVKVLHGRNFIHYAQRSTSALENVRVPYDEIINELKDSIWPFGTIGYRPSACDPPIFRELATSL